MVKQCRNFHEVFINDLKADCQICVAWYISPVVVMLLIPPIYDYINVEQACSNIFDSSSRKKKCLQCSECLDNII